MQQLRRVQVLQPLQNLKSDEPQMDGLEDALSDQGMEVRLHELKGHIQVTIIPRTNHPVHLDYVRMVQLGEDAAFPIGALRICGILKGIEYFLEGKGALGPSVNHLPHMAVRTAPQKFLWLEEAQQVLVDLLAHRGK